MEIVMLLWLTAAASTAPVPEQISWTQIITSAITAMSLILVPVAAAVASTWNKARGLASPDEESDEPKKDSSAPLLPPPAVYASTDQMLTVDVPDAFLDVRLTVTILNKILGEQVVKTYELQSQLDREKAKRAEADKRAHIAESELQMLKSMIARHVND